MRLIDKDALEEAVQGAINIMESHGISMIAASVPLAIIKGAPAIDAIPVEWIFEQMQILHELHNKNEHVLQWLMEKWQQEQEAR